MALTHKTEPEIIPQYSLTGDLISYLRCGLQYRYYSGSSLPPSRPVQQWFGEFIHGMLENAYRIWSAAAPVFPWPCNPTMPRASPPAGRQEYDLGTIGDIVEASLRAQGKNPRSRATRENAYQRVERAVNELGPHLFPLIALAEEKVIGTRTIPGAAGLRSTRYELHGVIDVVTEIELTEATHTNVIAEAIRNACPGLAGNFEVIVDYKGARRPTLGHPYWHQGNWQVQTYAWLRMRQPESRPVAAGVLLYVNELLPSQDDIADLQGEVARGETDVIPPRGSRDEYLLNTWVRGAAVPEFSFEFRFRRAIHIIPVDDASRVVATNEFDNVVRQIEECVGHEEVAGRIIDNWGPTGDDATCIACDFRHFCPNPSPRGDRPHVVTAPPAP
ncbi:MAG: PD-(D/E)XK nuclease family protein [Pyrinomonadaceae bacterium]